VGPTIRVVAALIEREGRYLVTQRRPSAVLPNLWEFPGGKVEPGERIADALARELHEELGIDVVSATPWITRLFSYSHATVRLHFFRVFAWRGEPHPREAQAFCWQHLGEPLAAPMLPANAPVLASLALPQEYAITNAAALGVEAQLAGVDARLASGLRLLQLREPELDAARRAAFARAVVERAHRVGARVLINDDAALADAVGADGVHYPARSLMAQSARPARPLVAASCHDAQELAQAMRLAFDFALLGPVKATASHPGAKPLGWAGFASIARGASLPVYAIGGMRPNDLERARQHGAHGLAMITGSWA